MYAYFLLFLVDSLLCMLFIYMVYRNEQELVMAAAQPLPDDDDDTFD